MLGGGSRVVGRDFGFRKEGDESFRFDALVLRKDKLSSVLPVFKAERKT